MVVAKCHTSFEKYPDSSFSPLMFFLKIFQNSTIFIILLFMRDFIFGWVCGHQSFVSEKEWRTSLVIHFDNEISLPNRKAKPSEL